jgi:hypothetical protein
MSDNTTQTENNVSPPSPERQGNAVFGGAPAPREEIPYDNVPLPSNGLIYPVESSLHQQTHVAIKVMTAREEDILTSPALLKSGKMLESLLQSVLMDKNINVNEMIAGDRNALMVALRITGYGAEYAAEITCSSCEEKYDNTFNLGELAIRRLEIQPIEVGMNLFEFVLPRSKKKVLFKFLTGHDEYEIDKTSERRRKITGSRVDSRVTDKLRYSIVEIDGSQKRGDIEKAIQRMVAYDSLSMRKFMNKHEPGIDMSTEVECPNCGHEEEVNMPLGVSFFYPDIE